MLDILVEIFKCAFTILGIIAVVSLIVCFITAPIENRRKKKQMQEAKAKLDKALKDLSDSMAEALIKSIEESEKQGTAKTTAPKTRKPRKKKEEK